MEEKARKPIDDIAENIYRQANELDRIESDVGKLLTDEVDKLCLSGSEKILVSLMILNNITVNIGRIMNKRRK